MQEYEFLQKLEERAKEQELLMEKLPLPSAVFAISIWLGRHPWRFIIPFSFILTLMFRMIFGQTYNEFILWIFGGL